MPSSDLYKRLEEWAVWYHQNKDRIPRDNLQKRIDFLEKAVDGTLELIALCCLEIRGSRQERRLLVPTGVEVRGDLTRLG